jgi:hypothetical protein
MVEDEGGAELCGYHVPKVRDSYGVKDCGLGPAVVTLAVVVLEAHGCCSRAADGACVRVKLSTCKCCSAASMLVRGQPACAAREVCCTARMK